MAKKKFYVVWEGKKKGIFDNWATCKKSIKGVKGAKYKSFETFAAAKQAFSGRYEDYKGKNTSKKSKLTKAELVLIGKPLLTTISVDAACSGNPGIMEYQGVETKTKKILFKSKKFADASNNVGEFLALVHGIAFLQKHEDERPIYSDSRIAIGWVRKKKSKTNIKKTKNNAEVFELITRAENWLNTNTFENKILKWETKAWGEIPADYGRK